MAHSFIQIAQQGKNEGWRYVVGAVVTLFTFVIPGSLAYILLVRAYVQVNHHPDTQLLLPEAFANTALLVEAVGALTLFVCSSLSFLFFWLGIYLTIRFLHGRSLHSLITPKSRINRWRIAQGFSVFFTLRVIEVAVSYAIAPTDFTLNFEAKTFLLFLGWAILLVPIQTAAEELFCRGYLLQGFGSKLGRWPAIILTALIFSALHSQNLEVSAQDSLESTLSLMSYYFMIGAFLAWLTLKEQTLELALGVHAANNMAAFLLITSPDSSIPAPAVFSVASVEANVSLLFFNAILLFIFSFIIFRLLKKPAPTQDSV